MSDSRAIARPFRLRSARNALASLVGLLVGLQQDERSRVRTVADLRPGERAVVARCRGVEGPLGQRLLQMGVLRGREVVLLRRAPGGDPLELRVLGSALSLRAHEARLVELEP